MASLERLDNIQTFILWGDDDAGRSSREGKAGKQIRGGRRGTQGHEGRMENGG